jgi:hypothetical protein
VAAIDTHATIEELFETVFSVRSVPRLYNEGQLPLEESLETTEEQELFVRQKLASKDLNTEAEEAASL